MFANVIVKESLEKIAQDRDFLHEKVIGHFSTFKPEGQNIIGVRRRQVSAAGVQDPRKGAVGEVLQIGPRGLETWQVEAMKVYVMLGGHPHKVPHNFGYWHINDMDELMLALPGEEPGSLGYSFLIMGTPKGNECDRLAQYCQKCQTLLFEHVYETGRLGFNGFWKSEVDAVHAYNADEKLRLCPECGHVNPLAYCWNSAKDTPAEREARAQW